MERYNFKLLGKKEMLVPYNDYKLSYGTKQDDLFKHDFINPAVVRWAKHRVWVVEADLVPGKRHIYRKRTSSVHAHSSTIPPTADSAPPRPFYPARLPSPRPPAPPPPP